MAGSSERPDPFDEILDRFGAAQPTRRADHAQPRRRIRCAGCGHRHHVELGLDRRPGCAIADLGDRRTTQHAVGVEESEPFSVILEFDGEWRVEGSQENTQKSHVKYVLADNDIGYAVCTNSRSASMNGRTAGTGSPSSSSYFANSAGYTVTLIVGTSSSPMSCLKMTFR